MELLRRTAQILRDADFAVEDAGLDQGAFLFEDPTVIGFALAFDTIEKLISTWEARLSTLTNLYQIAIRRSREKSWNTYAVLLCEQDVTANQKVVLQMIEEDLSGTRKIVRAGVLDSTTLMQALLPLLPLQGAPELPVVDMEMEIRARTSELPDEALKAFFSEASENIALQVIEEAK